MKIRVDEYFAQSFMKQNAKTRKCIVNWDFVVFNLGLEKFEMWKGARKDLLLPPDDTGLLRQKYKNIKNKYIILKLSTVFFQ